MNDTRYPRHPGGSRDPGRASLVGRALSWVATFVGMTMMIMLAATPATAERIKDLGTFQGLRANQLTGYGIVVGLAGTGDDNLDYTTQGMRVSPRASGSRCRPASTRRSRMRRR